MKKPFFQLRTIFWVVWLFATDCGKGQLTYPEQTPYVPVAINNLLNTAPKSYGGFDHLIILPQNSTLLKGSSYDKESLDKLKFEWKKIKGPETFLLTNKDSLTTKLENLVTGEYEFELTATDNSGLTGSDTVSVNVMETSGEIILSHLTWMCPMGCSLEFVLRVPAQKPVALFVRYSNSNSWVSVLPMSQYSAGNLVFYERDADLIHLYADDIRGADLKMLF